MHEIQLKTIWQIKQLKILPGMANGRVLKSQGKNGTLTSVMMGKLSLQSPALSKQALNFMLNKNALSADRKSILYLVKKNAWNLNPRVIHTSTPKIKIILLIWMTIIYLFSISMNTFYSLKNSFNFYKHKYQSYSRRKTFCRVYFCHVENSNFVRIMTTSSFSSVIKTLPLHLSIFTSDWMEDFRRATSVQHTTPEQNEAREQEVWPGSAGMLGALGQAVISKQQNLMLEKWLDFELWKFYFDLQKLIYTRAMKIKTSSHVCCTCVEFG